MPVVLPLGVVMLAMLLTLMAMAATILLRPQLEELAMRVPAIGGRIRSGIRRMVRAIEAAWRRWLAPQLAAFVGWLDAVAAHARELPEALADFAEATVHWLDHGFTVVVPQKIRVLLNPVRDLALDALERVTPLPARIADLRTDAAAWVRELRGDARTWLAEQRAEVRGWVVELDHAVTGRIAAVRSMVVEGVLPRLGDIELELPRLRDLVGGIRAQLDGLREWALPIAAVFSGAAVVALLRHVQGCRHGSDRLCLTDPDFLDELLGLALIAVSLTQMQAFVETTAKVAGALADEIELDR